MLWSFIAVCLSAWLSVDASYRGPTWQRWVFKPLTLLLLLLLAWQAPMFDAISYLVLAGLCASLLGDALTLLPRQRLMYAIGAFFPLAPAVHHLFRQSDDALFLLASATGVAGSGCAVTGDYLDAAGRVSLAYLHVYRHDAGDGVAGR
ncbi:inner membrane protein [Escherichia coli]|uniref:Inner membrane protein n=1 Tax=Escherichia coli TaxID=562 RepID=A0A377C608_ECOLX|nr:inner membrane protein [Escherichia coli]